MSKMTFQIDGSAQVITLMIHDISSWLGDSETETVPGSHYTTLHGLQKTKHAVLTIYNG